MGVGPGLDLTIVEWKTMQEMRHSEGKSGPDTHAVRKYRPEDRKQYSKRSMTDHRCSALEVASESSGLGPWHVLVKAGLGGGQLEMGKTKPDSIQ